MSHFKKTTIYLVVLSVASFFVLTGISCKKTSTEGQVDYTGVELTYYKVFDDSDVIEPLIVQFEDDHPGLNINYRKFSDFSEYERVILNEMAEGEGPDIFSMQNTWFASNYKKLTPLPKTMGTPTDFASTFVDVAYQDLVRTDQDGQVQVFGLPMTVDTLALYYNKDHFEDRIPERGKPSTTWEGIKDDVILLNKEDSSFDRFEVSGIALGRADNITRAVDILYMLFLQYGVEFYNDNISQVAFASRQGSGAYSYPALDALDFFLSFADENIKHYSWNEYVVDDDSVGREIEAFARGDVSMIIGYSYTYDLIINEINLLETKGVNAIDISAIKTAPIPQLYDPEVSSEKRVTYANYFAETVSRNSQYPETAWDFLVFITNGKNLDYYFEKTHKPTSRRDMIEEQKKDPIYGVFASQIGFAESFPIIDYYTYKDIFEKLINVAGASRDHETLLLQAQSGINEFLPEEGILVPEVVLDEDE
ncbi:MAG: extracellular solute-binding protein [Nitrospirae bacterium]|nr:extracellular solute-binding protein [Nitrospirota bacterium]